VRGISSNLGTQLGYHFSSKSKAILNLEIISEYKMVHSVFVESFEVQPIFFYFLISL